MKLAIFMAVEPPIEYGLRQSKNELGWADFRLTNYADIEKCKTWLKIFPISQLSQKLSRLVAQGELLYRCCAGL